MKAYKKRYEFIVQGRAGLVWLDLASFWGVHANDDAAARQYERQRRCGLKRSECSETRIIRQTVEVRGG